MRLKASPGLVRFDRFPDVEGESESGAAVLRGNFGGGALPDRLQERFQLQAQRFPGRDFEFSHGELRSRVALFHRLEIDSGFEIDIAGLPAG